MSNSKSPPNEISTAALRGRLKQVLSHMGIADLDESVDWMTALNSLEIFSLVTKIENEFQIQIHSIEVIPRNFRTQADVENLIASKLKLKS